MSRTPADDAAALLVQARRSGQALPALPTDLAPRSVAEAYAIQDRVAAQLGGIAGWKVGARGLDAEPSCAPIPSTLLHGSPHVFPPSVLRRRGIETEIAVRFGRDLPPRGRAYERGDVVRAIASLHAAIELVESRFDDPTRVDPLSVLADGNAHGALVHGAGAPLPDGFDSTRAHVELRFGAECIADVIGGNPAGDVMRLLVWLANHCAARSGGLRAGQVVTTGTCTGLHFAPAGSRVTGSIDGLPPVEIEV